jgi:hypothetical protein
MNLAGAAKSSRQENRAPVWICMLLALLLAGCTDPIPPDKVSYIGDWRAKDMELLLTSDSRVEYWRKTSNGTSKISAPIQKWEGNHFHVGIGVFSTRFDVSKPPAEKDGVWTMTVDGVELTRVGPGAQWTEETKPERTKAKEGAIRDLRAGAGTSPATGQSPSGLIFSYS